MLHNLFVVLMLKIISICFFTAPSLKILQSMLVIDCKSETLINIFRTGSIGTVILKLLALRWCYSCCYSSYCLYDLAQLQFMLLLIRACPSNFVLHIQYSARNRLRLYREKCKNHDDLVPYNRLVNQSVFWCLVVPRLVIIF